MADSADVKIKIRPAASVEVGFASKLGALLSLLAVAGTIAAAATSNDTATVTSGAAGALIALTTLGGRFAQAAVLARAAARAVLPLLETIAADDPPDHPPSS